MSFIQFNNVSFGYGEEPVLENVSFAVEKKQRVAIKSESGTGKTTLLRLLLGFEIPQKGEIRYQGNPVSDNNYSAIRRSTAWLPQDLNIGDGIVNEVITRIFKFSYNRGQEPGSEEVVQSLATLNLPTTIRKDAFRDLSTDQRQRVGLVICHLLNRPLLLLDEPTSALDGTSKRKVIELLFANPGRTIISVTHDPFWLERCDRIIELD